MSAQCHVQMCTTFSMIVGSQVHCNSITGSLFCVSYGCIPFPHLRPNVKVVYGSCCYTFMLQMLSMCKFTILILILISESC